MFNKSLLALTLVAIAGSALAAPVGNLKISGLVTPPTCTINGVEQGELVANFGAVAPSWLLATGLSAENNKFISEISIPLTVSCDAQTFLSFIPTDTYAGRNVGTNSQFRSALVAASNTSVDIGFSYIQMSNVKVDGKGVEFGRSSSSYTGTGRNYVVPGAINAWTTVQQFNVAPSALSLAAGRVFTTDLNVSAHLYSREKLQAQSLDLTEQIDYIGENVLAFSFGV